MFNICLKIVINTGNKILGLFRVYYTLSICLSVCLSVGRSVYLCICLAISRFNVPVYKNALVSNTIFILKVTLQYQINTLKILDLCYY